MRKAKKVSVFGRRARMLTLFSSFPKKRAWMSPSLDARNPNSWGSGGGGGPKQYIKICNSLWIMLLLNGLFSILLPFLTLGNISGSIANERSRTGVSVGLAGSLEVNSIQLLAGFHEISRSCDVPGVQLQVDGCIANVRSRASGPLTASIKIGTSRNGTCVQLAGFSKYVCTRHSTLDQFVNVRLVNPAKKLYF